MAANARRPPIVRRQLKITFTPDQIERLEKYCMRVSTIPPYKEISPSLVVRRGVLQYLEQLEAELALVSHRRARPACVYASVNGLSWCPEHDVRWEVGDDVPESCRGD